MIFRFIHITATFLDLVYYIDTILFKEFILCALKISYDINILIYVI